MNLKAIPDKIKNLIKIIDSVVFYRQESVLCQSILLQIREIYKNSKYGQSQSAAKKLVGSKEYQTILSHLENLENIFNYLTYEKYPEISLDWEIQKPMMDIMTNMNQITMSFSRLELRCPQYMPQTWDLETDFQILYGVFVGNSNPRVIKKLNSIVKFLKKHNIPIPGADMTVEVEKIFENISKFKLKHDDFVLKNKLGEGSTADVFKGIEINTNRTVAIKQLVETELNEEDLTIFKREINCLSSLKHSSLIEFIGATSSPPYWIINDYMPGGSLFARIFTRKQKRKLNAAQKTIIAYRIAEGMAYLHSKNIVHRDLKTGNILLDKKGEPKIIDFGIARKVEEGNDVMTMRIGTYNYMAPEVMTTNNYDSKIDVYSYGMVLYEMLMGQIPFAELSTAIQIQQAVISGTRPTIPSTMPRPLVELIKSCWSSNPIDRPTFEEILQMFKVKLIQFPITQTSAKFESGVSSFDPEAADLNDNNASNDEQAQIDQFYSSLGVQSDNISEDVLHILHVIENIKSNINNVVVYKKEVLRVRAVLDGYRIQLQNAPFVSQELTYEMQADLDNLLRSLEDLGEAILMITQNYWMNIALQWSVMKAKDDISRVMDDVYISMSQLGLKVPKYVPTDDDLTFDFKELFDIFAKSGSHDKHLLNRLKSVGKFLDSMNVQRPPLPPTVDEEIANIFQNIRKYKVHHRQFEKDLLIGTGSAGQVFKGIEKATKKVVAIKQLISTELDDYELQSLKREIVALSSLKHKNLVDFIGATSTSPYWLITEYMPNGSLYDKLLRSRRSTALSPMKKTEIAYRIAEGMEYLHSKNMIHRDLKTLNILLDENDNPKICDFGIARTADDVNMTGSVGTFNYMAPEVIRSTYYTFKIDVFSYGMMLWEILMCEVPFQQLKQIEMCEKIVNGIRPVIPLGTPDELSELIQMCWDDNPAARPSFSEILTLMKNHKIHFTDAPSDQVSAFYKSLDVEVPGNDQRKGLLSIGSFYRY
ncbi:hypothetical protein TRFO_12271 [Tritrichomonas foetus]|uniref:Protein kinase domain-containing protein n=1 Tax=Tritrichomonas foetus TaxID=1144522 RepID=A0A1J4IZQ7_9EUKA|nr:hypothetical protein TRFO_12271 [Tritrichomonas foetus]|eukprot:OHS92886.1 hypothetical protein TRFO_12271 [Tritrichomonas foetus]